MTYLLRHGAAREGLQLRADGFIPVRDLLSHRQMFGHTEAQLTAAVASCPKQRFALSSEGGVLLVRANQGHTVPVEELELERISDPAELQTLLHGTFWRAWDSIRAQGLSRQARNHIHLATGAYGEVASGVRFACELYVHIDAAMAMGEGVEFLRSANGVILTEGLGGVLPTRFFSRVEDTANGAEVGLDTPAPPKGAIRSGGQVPGAGAGPGVVSPRAQRVKQLRRKLQEIEKLHRVVQDGGQLQGNQARKLATEGALRGELEGLEQGQGECEGV